MVKVNSNGKMEENMKDNGKEEKCKGKENMLKKILLMRVNLKMVFIMVTVLLDNKEILHTGEIFKKEYLVEMDKFNLKTKINF